MLSRFAIEENRFVRDILDLTPGPPAAHVVKATGFLRAVRILLVAGLGERALGLPTTACSTSFRHCLPPPTLPLKPRTTFGPSWPGIS